MESNTNIILIDANRLNSEESRSGDNSNPAAWTNEVSAGIRLNAGDKVSVHSTFVSEIGCGDSSLETTGSKIGQGTFTKSRIIKELGEYSYQYGPYGCKSVNVVTEEITKDLRDNDFNFTMSYYKNTNGENTIHLPRRYDTDQNANVLGTYEIPYLYSQIPCPSVGDIDVHFGATRDPGRDGNGYYNSTAELRGKLWTQPDSYTTGQSSTKPKYRLYDDWFFYLGKSAYNGWSNVKNTGTDFKISGNAAQHVDSDRVSFEYDSNNHQTGPSAPGDPLYDVNEWRKRNDNSRYTIYMMENTVYTNDSENFAEFWANWYKLEPCWHNYERYRELKEYSVRPGFNDPNNIAYQLTSQITDKSEPEAIHLNQVGNVTPTAPVCPRYDCPISMTIEGEVFKPFACANWHTFGKDAFDSYFTNNNDNPNDNSQRSVDYLSSYQTIGIKRPEFYDAGRDMISHYFVNPVKPTNTELQVWQDFRIGHVNNNVWQNTGTDANKWLDTTIPFTEDNLQAISKLLKTQELYPELLVFPKRNTTLMDPPSSSVPFVATDVPMVADTPPLTTSLSTNTTTIKTGIDNPVQEKRMLHMSAVNRPDTINWAGDIINLPRYGTRFKMGSDGYYAGESEANMTQPVFFHYDKSRENTGPESPDELVNENNLSYGFAGKYLSESKPKETADYTISITSVIDNKVTIQTSQTALTLIPQLEPTLEGQVNIPFDFTIETRFNPGVNFKPEICSISFIGRPNATNEQTLTIDGTQSSLLQVGDIVRIISNQAPKWKTQPFIRLYLKDGLPAEYLDETIEGRQTVSGRAIGFDRHFSSYGNSSILLYSGMMPESHDGLEAPMAPTVAGGSNTAENGKSWNISKYIRQIYIGAIQPKIDFQGTQSRFVFSGLHTPEYIQNQGDAGYIKPGATSTLVPDTEDAGKSVYKINKILTTTNNWNPDMNPYRKPESFLCPNYKLGDKWGSSAKSSHVDITVTQHAGYNNCQVLDLPKLANTLPSALPGGFGGPTMGPCTGTSVAISEQQQYIESTHALQKFTVFDSHCGIFLEEFGLSESSWDRSMWQIMGLSYEQLNPGLPIYDTVKGPIGAINRQTRITRTNAGKLKGLTTNADIGLNDIPLYNKNAWDRTMYTLQLPCPVEASIWYGWISTNPYMDNPPAHIGNQSGFINRMIDDIRNPNIYPAIVIDQVSAEITADGLPIKMSLPYYLIKSNIIADSFYIRDKTPLPIVTVVNKENGFGDFYFQGESQLEFTITQETNLTFIRTEIYDADMTFAKVDKNSSIIYKITKQVPVNPDLINQILNSTKKK